MCLGNPCQCGGDDFDCYRPAQKNLLSMLERAPGCSIILAGDYHWGDIKALLPGADQLYSDWFSSKDNRIPIYQIMASGLTTSTAIPGRKCEDWFLDPTGLRVHPECDWVPDPNFGLIKVSWVESEAGVSTLDTVTMEIRDWANVIRLSTTLTPDQCNPREIPVEHPI
ncbi:unnamed protein product [Discosporangium mesarthrocarpum]